MRFKIATVRTPSGETRQVVMERETGGGGVIELTAESIAEALGYVPASTEDVEQLFETIADYHVPFANKIIVAIGDSITYGIGDGSGGYLAALKSKYPTITTVNMGVGSTTFADNNSVPANAADGCIFTRIDDIPDDADYIILQGGLNDYYWRNEYGVEYGEYISNLSKYPIDAYYDGTYHSLSTAVEYGGTSSAILDSSTFCGAFEMSLVKIMTRFHDKKFVLLIPHDPNGSAEFNKYMDAEARICKKYGFPCIDLRLSSGMPRIKAIAGGDASLYTGDGVHPNMTGYTQNYLPAIERWLTDGSVQNSMGAVTLEEVMKNPALSEKVTIKVTDENGNQYTYSVYGTLTDYTEVIKYTNVVPLSTEADGVTIYNGGLGYKEGYRLGSSGGESESTKNAVTGFIPVKGGETIRIKAKDVLGNTIYWYNTTESTNYLNAYTSEDDSTVGKKLLYAGNAKGTYGSGSLIESMSADEEKGISVIKLKEVSGIAFIRISVSYMQNLPSGADLIVTIDEEIT